MLAVKRGVERTLLHLQGIARNLLDALRDTPSVHEFKRYGLQDEQVKGALEKVHGDARIEPSVTTF